MRDALATLHRLTGVNDDEPSTIPRRAALAAGAALLLAPLALHAARPASARPRPASNWSTPAASRSALADFKGKHVVLEWTNPGCPFVQKHYGSQNMQSLQKDFTAKNVVWLSISSTAKGHGDYLAPAALRASTRNGAPRRPRC